MDGENEGVSFENVKSTRIADYKYRPFLYDQESRRCELLQNQKRKRESVLNKLREVPDIFVALESDSEWEEGDETQLPEDELKDNDCVESKRKLPKLKDMFMLSEWMIKPPENFEKKWLFVLCPVGKRCLVRCTRGCTTVYGKRGHQLAKFQSGLPNGSQLDYKRMTYSNSEITLLDCIWNPQLKSYFILDLLSWKGQFYMDTETSFRGFWIQSKMQEMPWLSQRSDQNPFPFHPLEYYQCTLDNLSTALAQHFHSAGNVPKLDGILFYHSEAYYTPGSTPLVVWLKPFMVPEIFRIAVPDFYTTPPMMPLSYVNMNQYINDYHSKESRKGKKPRMGNKVNLETRDELSEAEMMDEVNELV